MRFKAASQVLCTAFVMGFLTGDGCNQAHIAREKLRSARAIHELEQEHEGILNSHGIYRVSTIKSPDGKTVKLYRADAAKKER